MVKSKGQSKKQQKRGIDFKKIRRKVGRKLPPPKNATNTEIKSKAIVLPEQSIASDKAGLAVSKKGLTLKELLQQTSHHNAKVRKDALFGIRDILTKYPSELKSHKLPIIEKLRERISDDDKVVRDTLYQLFKSVVLPGCKEDKSGPSVSLMMAYVFKAMTHLAIEVRLMAFKFFELVIQSYPSSISLYGEKVLQHYEEILQKNKFYLQDQSKLKNVLGGLVCSLSLLPCSKREEDSSADNDISGTLHSYEAEAPKSSTGFEGTKEKLRVLLPVLVSCFQDYIPLLNSATSVDMVSFDCMLLILQSINFVVKFFCCSGKRKQDVQIPPLSDESPDSTIYDNPISAMIFKKLWDVFPLNTAQQLSSKDDDRYFALSMMITEIFLQLNDWSSPPVALLEKFLEFIEGSLADVSCSYLQSSKLTRDKQILDLIPFIPKLLMQVSESRKISLLEAFTLVFTRCTPESPMKLSCLSAIEEMLVHEAEEAHIDACDLKIVEHQITWIRELPPLLALLGDKHPMSSKAVLRLQLRLGQSSHLNSLFSKEYDCMQYVLKDFYCTYVDERSLSYGPFMSLPQDIQELSVCCLYYFSFLDSVLLQSLAFCCLSDKLEPLLLFRILEVVHSAYRAGHVRTEDHYSFLITILARFRIYPGEIHSSMRYSGESSHTVFRSITSVVCSYLSETGDSHLVYKMLEKVVLHEIHLKPPVDNMCALLRLLLTLTSQLSVLSEECIGCLSNILPEYIIRVLYSAAGKESRSYYDESSKSRRYYLLPCLFLFNRSEKLAHLALMVMASFVNENNCFSDHHVPAFSDRPKRLDAIVNFLSIMLQDNRIRQISLLCKPEVERILLGLLTLQSSEAIDLSIEERHGARCAYDRLRAAACTLFGAL